MIENRPIWPVFLYPGHLHRRCLACTQQAPCRTNHDQPPAPRREQLQRHPRALGPGILKRRGRMCLICDNAMVNPKNNGRLQKNTLTMTTSALKITPKETKIWNHTRQLVICEIGMQLDVFLKTNRFPCHNGSLWRHMAKYTSYPFSILHQTRVFIVLCTLTYITDWLLMYSTYHYLKAHLRKRQSIELKW